jgi:hypothetical protein
VIWDYATDSGPNPYDGFLSHAEHVMVTADSVTMLSEAAGTGRPVHILPLDGAHPKFERFHRELIARGIAKRFDGTLADWSYPPLQEARRVAEILAPRIRAKRAPAPEAAAALGA